VCNLDAKTKEPPDFYIDQGGRMAHGWLWEPGSTVNCLLNIIKSEYYKAWGKSGRNISALVGKSNSGTGPAGIRRAGETDGFLCII
jgi:hypothetical protein